MQHRKPQLLVTALMTAGVSALAILPGTGDTQTAPRVTGIYSNLQHNDASGDLAGEEIEIFPTHEDQGDFHALVQIALGAAPLAALVPVKVNGPNIELAVDMGIGAKRRFVGTVDAEGLTGNWYSGAAPIFPRPVHLKRGRSYWQGDGPL